MKTDTVKKNGNLNITGKYRNLEKLIANKKPKPMKEILDNYRYIEIKTVKKIMIEFVQLLDIKD